MRHKSLENKQKTNDTDSNIATIIMLIIILSGVAIGIYYLQKYNILNLVPSTSISEKEKEKDKNSGNKPGKDSLIVPEPLNSKISQDGLKFVITKVKADQKGYLLTGEATCVYDRLSWSKLYVDGVLIDGYYTKAQFEVQDNYDPNLDEELQEPTEIEFRITKTELDNYNIKGFSTITFFYSTETPEKKETRIKAETFNFTSNFTTDNTRKGLIHIDEKGDTKVRYYKTVKDNDYTYIYFDFKNSDYQANKEIVIKTMYINDKLYNMPSFKEVIYRGSERDVYIKIPRKKINNVKNIRISFYIIERAPDNSISKLYITNEYSKNV